MTSHTRLWVGAQTADADCDWLKRFTSQVFCFAWKKTVLSLFFTSVSLFNRAERFYTTSLKQHSQVGDRIVHHITLQDVDSQREWLHDNAIVWTKNCKTHKQCHNRCSAYNFEDYETVARHIQTSQPKRFLFLHTFGITYVTVHKKHAKSIKAVAIFISQMTAR